MSTIAQERAATWLDDPEAQELLWSFRRKPPKLHAFTRHFATTSDKWHHFGGDRVEKLDAIRERWLCQQTGADWHASNPDAAKCKAYMRLSEQQPAVDAVLESLFAGRTLTVIDFVAFDQAPGFIRI